jgi:transcriptional regulator with XRE-family HTH domain
MLSTDLIGEIQRLLAEGKLSQRKIAKLTGVSRGTVGAVANGKRQVRPRQVDGWEAGLEPQPGPPQHCPGCGGLVYLPCRLCRTREFLAAHPLPRLPSRPQGPLQLDLQEDHAARLRRLTARRWRRVK